MEVDGPGQSFGLFVWKLHSGELVIMVLGVSGREKERSPVRSHPLVLQTHKDMRGRKRGEEDSQVGMLGISPEANAQPSGSGASTYERRVVSPLQARENKRKKRNNKYCSSFKLCSSSIACVNSV